MPVDLPAALHARLAQELGPGMTSHKFVGYFLADKQQRIVSRDEPRTDRPDDSAIRELPDPGAWKAKRPSARRFPASCS